jgi:DNA-binding CsgD family transcriptional regulator
MPTQQIASKMDVSYKTIETYRARIKEKLGLTNAVELIQHAVQWALAKPN